MKSSVTCTDTFAPVTLVKSCFFLINSSTSGCLTSMLIIKAPRLPFCETSFVTSELTSINDAAPVDVMAALFTAAPLGLKFDKSYPTPPRLFINSTCIILVCIIDVYESSGDGSTKQFDNDTGFSLPSPAITEPAGMTYLKSLNNSYIRSSVSGSLLR